jgi:hypothetical protein
MENKKAVAFAVVDWLTTEAAAASAAGNTERSNAIGQAAQTVGKAYDLPSDEASKAKAGFGADRCSVLQRFTPLEAVLGLGARATGVDAAPKTPAPVDSPPAPREATKSESSEPIAKGNPPAAQKCVPCHELIVLLDPIDLAWMACLGPARMLQKHQHSLCVAHTLSAHIQPYSSTPSTTP